MDVLEQRGQERYTSYGLSCTHALPSSMRGAPFSAMWCELPPGRTSEPHEHHEAEAFFFSSGEGAVWSGDQQRPVRGGDVVRVPAFARHRIQNTGPGPLVFLAVYWENMREALESAPLPVTPQRKVVVTATPPTPNGDLHVGHLSGPYLAADMLARSARQAGREVLYLSGSDDHQSYVMRRARAENTSPEDIADRFAQKMATTLERAGCELSAFSRPRTSKHHVEIVGRFFAQLYERGKLVPRTKEVLYCDQCRLHLFEAHVGGSCPHCGSASDGCACEACGRPNDCADLDAPRCKYCGTAPSRLSVERLYLPLADYADRLRDFHARTSMAPHLRALCATMLSAGLPEIAVSHVSDWGIPFPAARFAGQKIYVWAEMAPGFFAEAQEVLDRRGSCQSWKQIWFTDEYRIVQCFGFDNAYFHTLLFPALFMAYDENLRLPDAFVTNEFLRLNGEKFSTSRNHAIWGSEILDTLGADYLRYYLAKIRPEAEQTNFRLKGCARALHDEFVLEFAPWLREYEGRRLRELAGGAPEPGAWTDSQRAFLSQLESLRDEVSRAYTAETFSARRAARAISHAMRSAREFALAHSHEAGIAVLADQRRTSLALEICALKTVSWALFCLAPGLSEAVWPMASVDSRERAEPGPAFARSGAALREIALPDFERLTRFIADHHGDPKTE